MGLEGAQCQPDRQTIDIDHRLNLLIVKPNHDLPIDWR